MSQNTEVVAKLYEELLKTFDETSEIDEEIIKNLQEKITKLNIKEFLKEFTELSLELNNDEFAVKDAAGNRMANQLTKSTLIKRRRKLKLRLDDLGRVLARFLPGFECVYETEVTKEINEYGCGVDEGDDDGDVYKPVESESSK